MTDRPILSVAAAQFELETVATLMSSIGQIVETKPLGYLKFTRVMKTTFVDPAVHKLLLTGQCE